MSGLSLGLLTLSGCVQIFDGQPNQLVVENRTTQTVSVDVRITVDQNVVFSEEITLRPNGEKTYELKSSGKYWVIDATVNEFSDRKLVTFWPSKEVDRPKPTITVDNGFIDISY